VPNERRLLTDLAGKGSRLAPLALSKLGRDFEGDRDDVQQLARAGHLKPEILGDRYYKELRPNLAAHEARHDLTLQLWLESYWPA
jgi:hypothetical protein